MKIYNTGLKTAIIITLFALSIHSTLAIEPVINAYQSKLSLKGEVNSTGSDTLASLMTFWTDEFKVLYPEVSISLHSEGSVTAPPALLNGTANIAPMSREMTSNEVRSFEQKFGYPPTPIKVAIDAIAIFVHKNNPLIHISISELEAIFSNSPRCTEAIPILHWHKLLKTHNSLRTSIDVYGRNSDSGTFGFFKKSVLGNGSYIAAMQRLPGNASIVQAISNNPNGIGFSGLGYKTSGVRTLAIMSQGKATLPDNIGGSNWDYPLARYLYLYVNKIPNKALPRAVNEFILYVLSKEGQTTVEQDGYSALTQSLVQQEIPKLTN